MTSAEPDNGKVEIEDPTSKSPSGQADLQQDIDSGSDTGEKPVRERLKHTTIAKSAPDAYDRVEEDNDAPMEESSGEAMASETVGNNIGGQPRPARKRSLEDLNNPEDFKDSQTSITGGHIRKRSRDVKTGDVTKNDSRRVSPEPTVEEENEDTSISSQTNGDIEDNEGPNADNVSSVEMNTPPPEKQTGSQSSAILSPRKKRSRDHLESDTQREQKIAATDETRARRSSEEQRPEPSALASADSTSEDQDKENGHVVAPTIEADASLKVSSYTPHYTPALWADSSF